MIDSLLHYIVFWNEILARLIVIKQKRQGLSDSVFKQIHDKLGKTNEFNRHAEIVMIEGFIN
jgi:hypothetical protein